MKPKLLLNVKRSNLIEKEHFGYILLVDENENILKQISSDDNEHPFFIRSCLKPFQALPILKTGAFDKFNLTLKELAICCASHSGTVEHINTVRSILSKIKLQENNLLCGVDNPFDSEKRIALILLNEKPTAIHNNCSGKHAGMLANCLQNNWDLKTYLDFEHPLQKEIFEITKQYFNLSGEIPKTRDGCSTPIYGMTLNKMGAGFLKLFLNKEAEKIKQAFIENPIIIGGEGKIDSTLIEVTKGRPISKIGADGLCIIANLDKRQTLVIKLMDATQNSRSIASIEALNQIGWLTKEEIEHTKIKKLYNKTIKTLSGISIGKIEPVFNL